VRANRVAPRSSGRKSRASGKTARSPKKAGNGSVLEDLLAEQIRLMELPIPERQAKLVPGRKFAFDFSWPRQKLAVEVQGGTWVKGAHSSGAGIERDCEKAALALLAGYRTLAVTGGQVRSGQALTWIVGLLGTTGSD